MQPVDLFILIFLTFLWCWDYPQDHPARKFVSVWGFPFVYLGLWHGWAMFAPEPLHVNRWLKAVIRFHDGTVEEWEPLRPSKMSKLLNTLYVRSFKFQHSVVCGQYKQLYQPVCEFLARQATDGERKVAEIELFREFQSVNGPEADEVYGPMKSVRIYEWVSP